jgi:protein involved in polysaccharide export with SLBB domain
MKNKLILYLALVLVGGLLGCMNVTKQSQAIKVSVIGDVKVPGGYVLPKGAGVVRALEAAGGLKAVGQSYDLVVVRVVNGQQKNFPVPSYYGKPKADFEIIDGDAIYVRMEIL